MSQKKSSFIRWKFVGPVGAVVAVLAVFFIFFFDPILERALEKAGSRVNGAKIEIDGLKTKFLKGQLSVQRLQVADRELPMTNRFETAQMKFQLDVENLLRKRFIIEESEIAGLKFGTPRESSGEIKVWIDKRKKEEKDSAAYKFYKKYENRAKFNIDGLGGEAKQRVDIDPEDLEVTKAANDLEKKIDNLPKEWEAKIKEQQFEQRLKAVEADITKLKQTPTEGNEALTAIPSALNQLSVTKKGN